MTIDPFWTDADHRNVSIKLRWDNEIFYNECGTPLYCFEDSNATIRMICDGVQNKDLLMSIKNLLDAREDQSEKSDDDQKSLKNRSIYREMMFVTLKFFGQENIDLTAFDREYRRAFERLPPKYQSLATPADRPPTIVTALCRKFFRELKI